LADEQCLPYIRAIIKEVRAVREHDELTVAHFLGGARAHAILNGYATEDFVYNEMYIPKNTVIVLNCYDIHHNEEKYPDPCDLFLLCLRLS